MIDVVSRGRLEIGLVKSGGSEMASNNGNPMQNEDRMWEGIDLISKALTHRDGPFSWEGKHFTHRHVNIWPGPYQQPMPRLWAATGDPRSTAECGRRGSSTPWCCAARKEPRRRGNPTSRRGVRRACLPPRATCLPTPPWSTSATPTRRACGSEARSCGSSIRASRQHLKCRRSCPARRRQRPLHKFIVASRGPLEAAVGPSQPPRTRRPSCRSQPNKL